MSKPTKKTTAEEKIVKNENTMYDDAHDEDEESGSEIEAEMELIYEDDNLRQEYEEARSWLDSLHPKDLLKATLFDDNELEKLAQIYKNNTPYPHLVIEDFIDKEFLDKIAEEIKTLEWKPKNNDLYLFHQSQLDLKATRSPLIKKLCQVLYCDEFVNILKKITKLPLFTVKSTIQEPFKSNTESPPLPTDTAAFTPDHPDFSHKDYSEPDMFSAVYSDTCRLLCHDDELEGRRIAYIIYLTPEWKSEWGGHLDLFNHEKIPSKNDFSYLPTNIEKAYAPKYAQFAFFEVSERSFHQVREVFRTIEGTEGEGDGQRLSISGWYHGPRIVREHDEYIPSQPIQLPPQNSNIMKPFVHAPFNQTKLTEKEIDDKNGELFAQYLSNKAITIGGNGANGKGPVEPKTQIEDNCKFWINKTYLTKATQREVVKKFENESSIDLVDFIKPSVYHQLLMECWEFEQKCFDPANPIDPSNPACNITPNSSISPSPIEFVGPCNQRVYYRYNPQNILNYVQNNPDSISALKGKKESLIYKFLQFLHSQSFFVILQLLTGMKVKTSSHELQLFRPGCYTLAHDNDPEVQREGLDVIYSLWSDNEQLSKLPEKSLPTTDIVKKTDIAWDNDDFGGSIHYLVSGEDDELLSVYSPSNTLSLVFRAGEERIFQFQRYLDHRSPGSLYRIKGLVRLEDE
jgi:Rps23 Pro-64 3,4-dihydroxylase Tpa1-like proline 4-hydroxylase